MRQNMGKISKSLWVLLVIVVVILIPTQYAYAYLDPGTGSFIIQIVVAGLLGILLTIRLGWDYIMATFKRMTGRETFEDEEEEEALAED